MDTYQLVTSPLSGITFVVRQSDNAWIPMDPANRDYQQYLKDTQG